MSIRTKVLVTIATVATMTAIGTTKAYGLENATVTNVEQIAINENDKSESVNKDESNALKNEAKDKEQATKTIQKENAINKEETKDKKTILGQNEDKKSLENGDNKDKLEIKKDVNKYKEEKNSSQKDEQEAKCGQTLSKSLEPNYKKNIKLNSEEIKINNTVQGKVVNVISKAVVRENASLDSTIIGEVALGEKVDVDKSHSNSEWYGICFGERGGFISTKYVELEKTNKNDKKNDKKDVVEIKQKVVTKVFNAPSNDEKKNIVEGEVIEILSKLNVRESASINSVIIGQLSSGEKIKVDKSHSNSEWYGICFGEHGGFVLAKYIKVPNFVIDEKHEHEDKDKEASKDDSHKKDENKESSKDKDESKFVLGEVINVKSHLNVREKPTTECESLGKIYEGNQVLINRDKSKDGWYEIAFGTHGGYVYSDYIKIIKKDYLITNGLVKFVASYEGYSATAYRGADYQNRTIGYGHVIMPGETYNYLTEPEARNLLKSDLNVTATQVKKVLDSKEIKLNTHQFDSLVSFAYNCGVQGLSNSRLLRDIENKADLAEIKDAFLAWRHCNGIELEGLRRRRVEEFEMYSTGDYIRDLI